MLHRFTSRITILWSLIIAFAPVSNAQQKLQFLSNSENDIHFEITIANYQIEASGNHHRIVSQDGSPLLIKGAPDLLKHTVSLAIGPNQSYRLSITDSAFVDYPNITILPSKGNLKRNQQPDDFPFVYGQDYQRNTFYPNQLAEQNKPYIIRDQRGMAVWIYPFRYNPVTKVLRVYTRLNVRLQAQQHQGENLLPLSAKNLSPKKEFEQIKLRHFDNYASLLKYTPLNDEGDMLIVCHNDNSFVQAMQPFILWKTQKGIKVDFITYTQAGGNATALKNYISSNFPTNQWTHILLVGDAPQITPFYKPYGPGDNWYGDIFGNDSYPDIFVGRFSAENASQVATQVQRSIWYEKDITGTENYFKFAMGIASDEGPGDNNEMDYEHVRLINQQLLNFTYSTAFEMFDGSQGGADAAGNPTPAMVSSAINDGIGIINYTGHGSNNSFASSGFSNSHVDNLLNNGKLPFIISVACVNGEFQTGTCFAEKWMRATHNGQPSGAVATLMSTINQSWNPPMKGQDEMNEILVELYANNIKRSFGGITMNGCMKMNDVYGFAGVEMTDTWTLFGDPSIILRTDEAQAMNVNHITQVSLGTDLINVNCNLEDALVAISQNGVLLGTQKVSGGVAAVSVPPIASMDTIMVTVTGFNAVTYQGIIEVLAPNAPYINANLININDMFTGNANFMADYGEIFGLDLILTNLGLQASGNLTLQLSTSDAYIQSILSPSYVSFPISAGSFSNYTGILQVLVKDSVPHQHQAMFNLSVSDSSGYSWNVPLVVTLHSPVLGNGSIVINDSNGNNNGRLDQGELVTMQIPATNNGAVAGNTLVSLSSASPYITINNPSVSLSSLGAQSPVGFAIQVANNVPDNTMVNFSYQISTGPYQYQFSFSRRINAIMEDFETNDFSSFNWQSSGALPWFTTNFEPLDGDFCSQSGAIGDNQQTSLMISINVQQFDSVSFYRKVSSEQDWDFLQFYIGSVKFADWSGIKDWERFSFPVSAGLKSFRWTYIKDAIISENMDCAWVDDIILPKAVSNDSVSSIIVRPSTSEGFDVYPNPAGQWVNLRLENAEKEKIRLMIHDAGGRLILSEEMEPFSGTFTWLIDVSSLPSGAYLVSALGESFTKRTKLIISR
jgi:hypothetical protein